MDAEQVAAFEGANPGGVFAVGDVLALSAGLVGVVVLVWSAWVALHAYKSWSAGRAGLGEAGGHVLRATLLTVVVLAVVTW